MDNLNDADYLDREVQQIFLWPRKVDDSWYQAGHELQMVIHPDYQLPGISERQKHLKDRK